MESPLVSLEAVTEFRALLARDADLQKTCTEALRTNTYQPVIDAAAARGLVFTAGELKQSVNEGELSDRELELVAGGASKDSPSQDGATSRTSYSTRGRIG
ncbi:hypothetical protein HK414_12025 [Ramlibacter terrae]|uniref:Nif11-like leader peptide family natural product n=1 Tax=Ramlibacter terrae TaxID=2732511 RepID=A0ABX6P2I6_9BURK|nr:hypothetical protein HK414_12025 [Ramlibacter terrae]